MSEGKPDRVVVRFCGDSGDGIQLMGELFTSAATAAGLGVCTLPEYPAEIRAPAGTLAGVSGYQVCIGTSRVYTPGDEVDVLVAMNPAALKTNISRARKGGLIFVNDDSFTERNLKKAGYGSNPLDGPAIGEYRLCRLAMSSMAEQALEGSGLSPKAIERCKNFFALGVMSALFERDKTFQKTTMTRWIHQKFAKQPDLEKANLAVFEKGWEKGRDEALASAIPPLDGRKKTLKPGTYRQISGNVATAMGLLAAASRSGRRLFIGSYPITPATEIFVELGKHPRLCTVFQAEDEIAGIGSAVGAAFGGALGATSTSGPGFSLKSEFIGLAVMAELPLVVVNVQRAGPSTGIPTKTEQADLLQALWGRHGESPAVVLAAASPTDCFDMAFEAARIALTHRVPVILLSDGYLGNGSEVWRVPDLEALPWIKAAEGRGLPGTPGKEHRLGGLEKEAATGAVSGDSANHEKMVRMRAEKVERVAAEIPMPEVYGQKDARVLVVGWGSTYGVIRQAVEKLAGAGQPVAAIHLRHLNPLPEGLEGVLKRYPRVLVVENNSGQLWYHLRGRYLLAAERLNKIQGTPFREREIEKKVRAMIPVSRGDLSLC